MTTTAGHSFYIGPIVFFYNQVNDTGSWEPLVQISAHVSCCRIPSGNLSYYMFIIPPGLYCNHLVRPFVCLSICPSVHTFVTDISASTGRNDFIFDIWLWHGDLYHVSPFQVYRTSTSCLQCDLEFFMFAVMKTFVTVISASTRRNDFIFDIWLWHDDLYCFSPFQVYRTSTSCLPCDLQMNEWGYS